MKKILLFISLAITSLFANATEKPNPQPLSPCPSTAAEAKKAFLRSDVPEFSSKCYDDILHHLSNGEEEWFNNAQFLRNSSAAGFTESIPLAMIKAITKNPALILEYINDPKYPDAYKNWCIAPFPEATSDEIISFDNTAITSLKNSKIPPHLDKLRQQCIVNFIQDRDHAH